MSTLVYFVNRRPPTDNARTKNGKIASGSTLVLSWGLEMSSANLHQPWVFLLHLTLLERLRLNVKVGLLRGDTTERTLPTRQKAHARISKRELVRIVGNSGLTISDN